jgi:isoquinoline 1-oxidoreductase subunit alpha
MRFELNGRMVDAPSSSNEHRLLWLLRDHFILNGPKFGCGEGICGACIVHVDGEAVRSCLMKAGDVAGRRVTTLEGLGRDKPDGLHPVQAAWIALSVPQCGYCQNGQIMTAAALLDATPEAGPDEVAAAMDPVFCRCGTHARIKAAIALVQRTVRR